MAVCSEGTRFTVVADGSRMTPYRLLNLAEAVELLIEPSCLYGRRNDNAFSLVILGFLAALSLPF